MSKGVEDIHVDVIKKILEESGLVCTRVLSETTESSIEEEAFEEVTGEEVAAVPEVTDVFEEYDFFEEEVDVHKYSDIFPTPSLRRIIPERLRRIEAQNRINVLPEPFKIKIDPAAIPKIDFTPPQVYIDILAEMTGCTSYKSNLAEYWFLDTLANVLRRAQADMFDREGQRVLIHWVCEWMKEMQHFDAATRERMLRRWKDNMIAAAEVVGEEGFLPTPDIAGVKYMGTGPEPAPVASQGLVLKVTTTKSTVMAAKSAVVTKDVVDPLKDLKTTNYECSTRDLGRISHYIYDLFSSDYQYELVRSIFTFGPEYHQIYGPYQIEIPRRLYTVLKPMKTPAKPKQEKKGKKQEPDNEEYLALMALKEAHEQEVLAQQEAAREDWNRRSTILPLNFSVTPDFFEQYWPSPVEEVVSVFVMDADPKDKKKKKK